MNKYFQSYSFRRHFRRQFSTVFHVILQAPSPGIAATSLIIWQSLIEYFKSYSFRRQFRRQFSTVYHGILQAPSAGIRQLPCQFGEVWLSTAKVIHELSVKFDWVFLKVIHLDVNSDVNSQQFTMWFCRHHRLVFRQLLCKCGEVCLNTSKVIN